MMNDMNDDEWVTISDEQELLPKATDEVVDIVTLSTALIELYNSGVETSKSFAKDKHRAALMLALEHAVTKYVSTDVIQTAD